MTVFPTPNEEENWDNKSETSHGHSSTLDQPAEQNAKEEPFAQEETKQIWIWKQLVIVLIIATAALVSAGTYKFLKDEEESDFQDSYAQFVNTIRDASEFHSENIFRSLRAFSDTITTEASALNLTFPFVTLPTFEALGAGVRSTTGAEMINWHPRVEQDQLAEWSKYALGNYKQSLAQSRATALSLDAEGSTVKPSDYLDGEIAPLPYIPNFKEGGIILAPKYGEGPYFPAWMVSPPIFNPSFINSDPSPWVLKEPISAVQAAKELILSDTVAVSNLANRAIKLEDHEAYHQSLVDYVHDPNSTAFEHPHSAVMVPVFERLNDPTSRLVGTFAVVIPWDRYLVNLLPSGVDGITCALRNSCGKVFTYQLNGNSAFYIGEGDFHEHAYSDTHVELPFEDYIQRDERVPGECTYSFHIYATRDFEDQYRSSLPLVLTCVVAATFCIMIFTFLIYDGFVRQRNDKVVGVATLAASLFPSNVRDRLMEEESKVNDNKNTNKKRVQNFLSTNYESKDREEWDNTTGRCKTRPIADLFEESTIFFADIAGFTKWSSSRDPSQVFTLLESIFHEFDVQAKRRGVFKVETIGDCYVAVTGVPSAQRDHVVRMAKFARAVVECSQRILTDLQDSLGADTADLAMRIGLHSGSVTAGVLRGERGRFQLFGDTVNTAARMESNGIKGKIHISQATYEALVAQGKGHWCVPRDDLIIAKGKGEMKTWWLLSGSVSGGDGRSSVGKDRSVDGMVDDAVQKLTRYANSSMASSSQNASSSS